MVSGKAKTFKTRTTFKGLLYTLIPFCAALLLINFSLEAHRNFSPVDPSRWAFVIPPFLISVFVLISLLIFHKRYLGLKLVLKGRSLVYSDRQGELELDIIDMAYSAPPEKGIFRTVMLSNGKRFIQIPEIFMEKESFHELVHTINKLRLASRTSGKQKTFSL